MTGWPKWDREKLAAAIDHTLLKPDAGREDVRKLCDEALEYRFHSVCVHGGWVPFCRGILAGSPVSISAVCGFPLGAAAPEVKAFEAARAVENGASEIDMVLQIGRLREGDEEAVREDIRQVVEAVKGGAIVKVILETGMLADDQKKTACRLAAEAGAHFVKTSTGFGPGGATAEDVRLLRAHAAPGMGVKASGGIRDLAAALRMLQAGANRLGTSSGVAILQGGAGDRPY
jgi:deoxyribose-phosphate aldolase